MCYGIDILGGGGQFTGCQEWSSHHSSVIPTLVFIDGESEYAH